MLSELSIIVASLQHGPKQQVQRGNIQHIGKFNPLYLYVVEKCQFLWKNVGGIAVSGRMDILESDEYNPVIKTSTVMNCKVIQRTNVFLRIRPLNVSVINMTEKYKISSPLAV